MNPRKILSMLLTLTLTLGVFAGAPLTAKAVGAIYYIVPGMGNAQTTFGWTQLPELASALTDGGIINITGAPADAPYGSTIVLSADNLTVIGDPNKIYNNVSISSTYSNLTNFTLENVNIKTKDSQIPSYLNTDGGIKTITINVKGSCSITGDGYGPKSCSVDAIRTGDNLVINGGIGNSLTIRGHEGIDITSQSSFLTINADVTVIDQNSDKFISNGYTYAPGGAIDISVSTDFTINGTGSLTVYGEADDANCISLGVNRDAKLTINGLSLFKLNGTGVGCGVVFASVGNKTLVFDLPNPAAINGGDGGFGLSFEGYPDDTLNIINNGAPVTIQGGAAGINTQNLSCGLTFDGGNVNILGSAGPAIVNVTSGIKLGSVALSLTNNSAEAEIHGFSPLTADGLMWKLTNAAFTSGKAADDNVSISAASGQTGVITRGLSAPVNLSGLVKSYNPNNSTTVQLLQNGTNIIVDTKTISPEAGNGQITQGFLFTGVLPGVYSLKVTKPAHTSYTVNNIAVGDKDVDLTLDSRAGAKLMTLLVGDVNSDGVINVNDLNIVWSSLNYGKTAAAAQNQLCDLNGDGVINVNDLNILWSSTNYGKGAVVVN